MCVRAYTHYCDEHGLLLFLLGSIFDPTLHVCKHKYRFTKRYKGVDRQLLIMNQTSAGTTETSISGVKGHNPLKPSPLPGEEAVPSPCSLLFSLALASAVLLKWCNCSCCHVVS